MLCFDPKSLHLIFFQHIPSCGGMLQLWVKAVSCLIFLLCGFLGGFFVCFFLFGLVVLVFYFQGKQCIVSVTPLHSRSLQTTQGSRSHPGSGIWPCQEHEGLLQPCLHVSHMGHTNPQCSCGYFCLQSMSGSQGFPFPLLAGSQRLMLLEKALPCGL